MENSSDKFVEIVICQNNYFKFPKVEKPNGDILILGNFNGICGDAKWFGEYGQIAAETDFFNIEKTFFDNLSVILGTINKGGRIAIASSTKTIEYFKNLLYSACYYTLPEGISNNEGRKKIKDMINRQVKPINTDEIYERTYASFNYRGFRKCNAEERLKIFVDNLFKVFNGVKFDTIIQNPPFNGSLHLEFLKKGIELLNENGKMVIIEPATWLINVRTNGKAKIYNEIKKQVEGHVESIIIENFNNEFRTGLYTPFSITKIDMGKHYDKIDFVCCGEKKEVNSIYDCNLIGNYDTIWSIFNKVKSFGDMMKNHITNSKKADGMWYAKYHELTGRAGVAVTASVYGSGMILENAFSNPVYYKNGYVKDLFHCGYSTIENDIKETPHYKVQRGGANGSHKLTDKIADNVYGSKEELENWKHFIFDNKLSLFINIVLTIDQHNNSKDFLPWLVDKQYTDDEINELFGFSEEEILLIDKTLKKFERHSPWFKRYLCGPDSVSDEEVNNFIEKL